MVATFNISIKVNEISTIIHVSSEAWQRKKDIIIIENIQAEISQSINCERIFSLSSLKLF